MVQEARGYTTKHGRFFTSKIEAEVNEAEEELRELLASKGDIDIDSILAVVLKYPKPFHRYVAALLEAETHAKGDKAATARAEGARTDRQAQPAKDKRALPTP